MKFAIRDLLLVTVIVAILVAWWIDHRRQVEEIHVLQVREEFEALSSGFAGGRFHRVMPNTSAPTPNSPKP
jgi:hypothetical protein